MGILGNHHCCEGQQQSRRGDIDATLITADWAHRRALLMRAVPLHCDVIMQRWEKFTGKKAERVAADEVAEATA